MHFLEQIDFCYSIVGLSYKGHKRYKSCFGGIVSISLFFSFIGIICYYLISFISRETPKMTFEDMKYWSAPENDISKNFTMAIVMKFNGINQSRTDLINTCKNGNAGASKTQRHGCTALVALDGWHFANDYPNFK